MRQGPLAGRYYAVAGMVLLALIPYLALSAALEPISPIIGEQIHASAQTMSLGAGLSNAAYAFGTVLAVQLTSLLPVPLKQSAIQQYVLSRAFQMVRRARNRLCRTPKMQSNPHLLSS